MTSLPPYVLKQGQNACRRMGWSSSHAPSVAEAIWKGIQAEREACAVLAERMPLIQAISPAHVRGTSPQDVAKEIRKRGAA